MAGSTKSSHISDLISTINCLKAGVRCKFLKIQQRLYSLEKVGEGTFK
jgi:hypothetical protein